MSKDPSKSVSWQRLEELAGEPYDISTEGALLADDRISTMVCQFKDMKLLYATQRITTSALEALQGFADEHRLVDRFIGMKRGDVINRIAGWPSENRQVLHTSSRDLFFDHPAEPESARQAQNELDKLKVFLAEIGSGTVTGSSGKQFTTMINIGIGGSDLGPRGI